MAYFNHGNITLKIVHGPYNTLLRSENTMQYLKVSDIP